MLFGWEVVPTQNGPGARSRHCLIHDAGAKATLLFGGIVWAGGPKLQADTWELRNGEWSQIKCRNAPAARHRGAMAYDAVRGNAVMFGGQASSGALLRDTWLYADRSWQPWRAGWWASRPAARCGHCLAFDDASEAVVLFGGIDRRDRPLGDTWLFDGAGWKSVEGAGPPARRYAAFAYDPELEGCVLHGGAADDRGHHYFGDAWLFRNGAWAPMGTRFETDGRDDHSLVFHQSARRLIMLEGVAGARGALVREPDGWKEVDVQPLHPRYQCSPMVWNEELNGLVMHGGESHHGGPQLDCTLVLRLLQS